MGVFLLRLIQKFSYDTKISHKLIIAILGMIVVPVICLGMLFYYKVENMIKNEISSSYEQIAGQYSYNINYKLDIHGNLIDNIIMNGTVQKVILQQDQTSEPDVIEIGKQISNEVDSLIYGKNVEEIHSIKLYSLNKDFPEGSMYASNLNSAKDYQWYDDMVSRSDEGGYFFYTTEGLKKRIVSFIKPIVKLRGENYREKIGIIKLDIDMDKLFNIDITRRNVMCEGIAILDSGGELILSSEEKGLSVLDMWKASNMSAGGKYSIVRSGREKRHILAAAKINRYGWTVIFAFPYSAIGGKVLDAMTQVILTMLGILAGLVVLTCAFSVFFSKRIHKLIQKMRRVQEGCLEIDEIIRGNDEIGMVDRHFNNMVGKLKELINENYVQQLEKREAELNALQTQINPHFLYNTLEVVHAIASSYECSEVCTISQNLGEMFRYSISIGRSEFAKLQDEIRHIRNYISIQMIRFDWDFDIVYDISDRFYGIRVLKFILQPIVENSFIHGFKGKKAARHMVISAENQGSLLILKVKDNGRGMSAVQLADLNAYLNERKNLFDGGEKRSIGIKNVNSRIKLAYGEIYGLSVESIENEGTEVAITLPYIY